MTNPLSRFSEPSAARASCFATCQSKGQESTSGPRVRPFKPMPTKASISAWQLGRDALHDRPDEPWRLRGETGLPAPGRREPRGR